MVDQREDRGPGDVVTIAGGSFGPRVTSKWDCNVYVVRGRKRSVIIDAGSGQAAFRVPNEADFLLLTHLHFDHAGGARRIADLGLGVLAHSWTADGLARGDEARAGLSISRDRGFYPREFTLTSCPTARPIADGESLDLGGSKLTAYSTPGHSDGHHAYLLEGSGSTALFGGDLVFEGGSVVLQPLPDCRLDALWESLVLVRDLKPERLYPGHGRPVLRRATDHIERAIAAFASGGLPSQMTWSNTA
jgi:glyoxylase-like metal-dependent hydrolase (beta-lactamase superfamily II)